MYKSLSDEMMVRFHCGRMIAIFPESSFSLFPLVKLLSCPACDQLHRLWDGIAFSAVEYEQMDVVRGGHVVEDPQTVAFFGFKQPVYQGSAISREFKKKFSLVAAVGNVPRVSGQEVSLSSGHGRFTWSVLKWLFWVSKRFKNLCGAKPCVAATQIRFELSLGRVWNYNVQELGAGGQWGFL
jgi:hypothetical protein